MSLYVSVPHVLSVDDVFPAELAQRQVDAANTWVENWRSHFARGNEAVRARHRALEGFTSASDSVAIAAVVAAPPSSPSPPFGADGQPRPCVIYQSEGVETVDWIDFKLADGSDDRCSLVRIILSEGLDGFGCACTTTLSAAPSSADDMSAARPLKVVAGRKVVLQFLKAGALVELFGVQIFGTRSP